MFKIQFNTKVIKITLDYLCIMFSHPQWYFLDKADSTNNIIQKKLAEGNLPEGSVVVAGYQSSGKGQRGSSWHSNPGENLLFSTVLYPTFLKPEKLFWLSKVIALAASDFVASHAAGTKIKWPNDIYIGNKKTGGILIENTLRGSDLHAAVVGTGINLNQEVFDIPHAKATSLKIASGEMYDVPLCARELLGCIEQRYDQLKKGSFEMLENDYHNRLYLLNTPAEFQSKNGIFKGKIKGVNEQGLLMVERGKTLLTFDIKEIVFLN